VTRRLLPVAVLAATLGLLFGSAAPALAQPPSLLDLSIHSGGGQFDGTIEKQTWTHADGTKYHIVANPTSCTWDINDHNEFTARGDVAPGSVTSTTFCHIASAEPLYACYGDYCAWWSGSDNWVGLQMYAKTADVKATICFSQDRCFDAFQTYDRKNRVWVSQFCVTAIYRGDPYDPAMVDIPDSNGGIGAPEDVTFTVRGTQAKGVVHDVGFDWGLSSDIVYPNGCLYGVDANGFPINVNHVPHQSDYPFVWAAP
jgi:hypothetical protein